MVNTRESGFVGARVPLKIKREILRLVQDGSYLNESEFLRDAIREKLATLGEVRYGAITE